MVIFFSNLYKSWQEGKAEIRKPKFKAAADDDDDPYIQNRLGPFIRFFEKHQTSNRRKEQFCQYLIIIFGALIPIINVAGIDPLSTRILSAFFGAAIAVLTAILQFEKYHERWQDCKRTATKLANEYYLWKYASGDYAPMKKKPVIDGTKQTDVKNTEKHDIKQTGDKNVEKSDYEVKSESFTLLVENCEAIITSEAYDYVALFSSPSTNLVTPSSSTANKQASSTS
jgi:Protein of unknown function (DUF4231)